MLYNMNVKGKLRRETLFKLYEMIVVRGTSEEF